MLLSHLIRHASFPSPGTIRNSRRWQFGLSLMAWLTVLTGADFAHAETLAARNNPESGQLLLKSAHDFEPAIHLLSEVDIQISGMVAKVKLVQRFENNTDAWREGVYVFPLAESAAVNYMHLQIGERRIVGTIKEREEAKRIYQQAKSQGKKAALTEQERPNLFTQSVANIGPGETVTVEIHYLQKVEYRDGVFNLHFPMTLTPRYNPGIHRLTTIEETLTLAQSGSGWGVATHQVPDAQRITPPQAKPDSTGLINPARINITLDAGLPLANVEGVFHPLRVLQDGGRYRMQPEAGDIPMDRDFRLQWRTAPSDQPQAAVFSEVIDNQRYAMAMLLPPSGDKKSLPLPRDVVFIIDTSGSMQGSSILQAKRALQLALTRLRPNDTFNVIEFDNHYSTLFPQPVQATPRNVQRAQFFVRSLRADGGTEMAPALSEALRHDAPDGHLKQVIFITDGAVGNESYLFELINTRLGDARLFTVGIGSAPNSHFMRKAAQFGRGTFTYIGDIDQVSREMLSLFEKIESPVMSNLTLEWPEASDIWPQRIPDLYRGEPVMVVAKLADSESIVTLRGAISGQQWQRSISVSRTDNHNGVSSLWAREKIAALLDQKIAGRDANQVRSEVLDVALRHQLLSPYTSLVAVEQTPSRPVNSPDKSSNISNAVPHGQKALHYPRTATSAPLQLALGGVGLLAWLLIRRRSNLAEQVA